MVVYFNIRRKRSGYKTAKNKTAKLQNRECYKTAKLQNSECYKTAQLQNSDCYKNITM